LPDGEHARVLADDRLGELEGPLRLLLDRLNVSKGVHGARVYSERQAEADGQADRRTFWLVGNGGHGVSRLVLGNRLDVGPSLLPAKPVQSS
jgi:hypothetical protein